MNKNHTNSSLRQSSPPQKDTNPLQSTERTKERVRPTPLEAGINTRKEEAGKDKF